MRETTRKRHGPRVGALCAAPAVLLLVEIVACGIANDSGRPNVILITLDTTRVDRLGCYAPDEKTSPNLDRLAAESVVYTHALSTTSWTLPAHASLFTGKLTTSHGTRLDPHGPLRLTAAIQGPQDWDRFRARGLSSEERTLAEILQGAGYSTAAVVAGPWLKRMMGLAQGFQSYDDDGIGTVNGRPASEVTDRALAWVHDNSARRFFLFLNYFDPHWPQQPPDAYVMDVPDGASEAELRSARYDGEIRFMDHHIGRLLDELRKLGLYESSWIIITADHGELLGEHGLTGHGTTLYQEVVHIPLIIKYPNRSVPAGTADAPVQIIDLFPTILEALDLPAPSGIQGIPLSRKRRRQIAEVYPLAFMLHAKGKVRALVEGNLKYVWTGAKHHELFDLSIDPHESRDLSRERRKEVLAMWIELSDTLASLPAPLPTHSAGVVDAETEKALRSLGYLE